MAIDDVIFAVLGKKLSKASICILLAQSAHEQGSAENGDRSYPWWNGFGVKAVDGQPFFYARTKEGHGATEVTIRAKFRAFDSLQDGVKRWVTLLATAPRYARGWARLEAGDYDGFVSEIGPHLLPNGKQDPNWGGYYTGSPIVYTTSMRKHWSYCALRSMEYGITKDEVRRFQRDHGIIADGLLGPQSRKALAIALGGDGQP